MQIPYLEVDKYNCTQKPVTKNYSCGLLRVTGLPVFIRKDREASNLPLCYLTAGYLENCVYFHIVFSLLVVDGCLEILEFLVIYIDVIDRERNARSHLKIYIVPCQTRFSSETSEN